MIAKNQVKRRFILGDEWLFYKIYGGPSILEKILLNEIKNTIDQLLADKIIEKYFFVRYQDPQYHVRLRVFILEPSNLLPVVTAFRQVFSPLIQQRLIAAVQTDTYNREIERYGSDIINEIESLFNHSSQHILRYLADLRQVDTLKPWHWGMKYVDAFLDAFSYTLQEKISFFTTLSDNFSGEVDFDKGMKLSMDNKYRKEMSNMEELLRADVSYKSDIFDFPLKEVAKIAKSLDGELDARIKTGVIASIVHMHFNRLFRSKQRSYELVIYYLMKKYYVSFAARTKYAATSS
jgi:thiopeptide-type bacteriocin biosynthesis protein